MKIRRWGSLILFVALGAWAQPAPPPALTLPEYAAALQRYEDEARRVAGTPEDIPPILATAPNALTVAVPPGTITVSTEFVGESIRKFRMSAPADRGPIVQDLADRLATMREEALQYGRPAGIPADSRERLRRILTAREFNQARGPSGWEILRDQIAAWLQRILAKLNPRMPESQVAGPIFTWCVIVLASGALGIWLYRLARRREVEVARPVISFSPSEKGWRTCLAEAREQAAQQRWRDAIHIAFWAAVARLEEEGLWRPNRARTPREYLDAIPSSSSARLPFASLLRRFEVCWYGVRGAAADDFASIRGELEKIGCK